MGGPLESKAERGAVAAVAQVGLKALAGVTALILLGNLVIYAASTWAKRSTPVVKVDSVSGIDNLEAVDAKLWRGGAPSNDGYRALAASGATTVIDLRAEHGLDADAELVRSLGMNLVALPIRDGQTPTAAQVDAFLAAVENAPGRVFVHCGAGVGRTGTMVAAYLVSNGAVNGRGALRRNLAVGPPSLEQVAFVAKLGPGRLERPGAIVRTLSRVIDGPRRVWARLNI